MDFVGIIAEYDPFHNGHAAQLAMVRAQGAKTIAVCMSAGLTQRGGIPFLPEPYRVQAALLAGADLVIALPAPCACAGAEAFAATGVHLLGALGCDTLAFGAETPDAEALDAVAALLMRGEFSVRLKQELAGGQTFAVARAAAAEALLPGAGALLASPNNILGVEYCKAIRAQHSTLAPLALPRLQANHNDATPGATIASASFLRAAGEVKVMESYVPESALLLYRRAEEDGLLPDTKAFSVAVLSRLRDKSEAHLAQVRGLSEGLEHRLYAAVQKACTVEELYDLLKTKRYPHARLRRLVTDAALGYGFDLPMLPPYLHVLGAKREALPMLERAALPVSTSLRRLAEGSPQAAAMADAHSAAVNFGALCRQRPQPVGLAFTQKPVLL